MASSSQKRSRSGVHPDKASAERRAREDLRSLHEREETLPIERRTLESPAPTATTAEPDSAAATALGATLRSTRQAKKLSLRDITARSDFNSGYLSLLERGTVKQPTPQVLRRLADAYDEPFQLLMELAGYIETDPAGLTPNAQRALKLLGPDPTDDELEALRTILDMLRKQGRAPFSVVYDLDLATTDRAAIQKAVRACLREADAIGVYPTPLDRIYDVARLAQAGELKLSQRDQNLLQKRFGEIANRMLRRLQGVVDLRSDEVWVDHKLHPMKQRFVLAHEAGHKLLDWQRDTFAFLDDSQRLRQDTNDLFERQANEAAIELLTQGGRMREEADDDNPPTLDTVERLSDQYGVSLQGTARYIAENSRRACACAIAFRSDRGQAPYKLFCSEAFEQRLGWRAGREPQLRLEALVCSGGLGTERAPLACRDVVDRDVAIRAQVLNTPWASIAWLSYKPRRRLVLPLAA